jgi:hypothetical protein
MSIKGIAILGFGIYKWAVALTPYGAFIRHQFERVSWLFSSLR